MPSEGLLETIHRQWRDPFHGMLTLRVRIACETYHNKLKGEIWKLILQGSFLIC